MSGDTAFKLHDTFGFPIDLTLEMAAEHGLSVDEAQFRKLMTEQRDRAKADARAKKSGLVAADTYRALADVAGASDFTGYQDLRSEGVVKGVLKDGEVVPAAAEGDEIEIVLDRTPFYAEGGGQLADGGTITLANGATAVVDDVQQPIPGLIVHRARVISGEVETGLSALGVVDDERRRAISRAHSATHMVHKAMREFLGETATQAGSENAPGRFRFDFPNSGAVAPSVLADVEQRVNEVLIDDLAIDAEYMSLSQARDTGAMALFGEKYGDTVRVVSVGDWARELCGGTHAARTGQLGVVKLLGESSIGAGVRRVEALVGMDAYQYLAREHTLLHLITEQLKTPAADLPDRIAGIVSRLKDAEREIDKVRREQAAASMVDVAGQGDIINGVRLFSFQAPDGTAAEHLRDLVLQVQGRGASDEAVIAVGASKNDEKVALVAAANDAAQQAGWAARDVLAAALPSVAGRGGGKADVAQGGGTDPAGFQQLWRLPLTSSAVHDRGMDGC